MFRILKEDKRANHLDTLDSFDVWKENYFNQMDEKSTRNLEKLRRELLNTKSHMNEQFEKPDNILVKYNYQDIDEVESAYIKIFENRKIEIAFTRKQINSIEKERKRVSETYISNLKKNLNDIGYILIGEVEDLINEKKKNFKEFHERKTKENQQCFEELESSESVLFEEAKVNFENFVNRWKDIKLNKFLDETKEILNSEAFVDNPERYQLIEELKIDQESIYNERLKLINKQISIHFEEITNKKVEGFTGMLEEIYNKAQSLYDKHTQNLVDFSDKIYKNSMSEIEVFKNKVKTIRYVFESENGQEELIKSELIPIISKSKEERTEYSKKIIEFIDEHDDFVHNSCLRLLRIFKELGKKNDMHKVKISYLP